MENRNRRVIQKMMEETQIIAELIYGLDFDVFNQDERTKRAVCMTLIDIGELVKNLTDQFRDAHKQIAWRAIAGIRDIAAHRYEILSMADIWETVQSDVPVLAKQQNAILQEILP